MTYHEQSFFSAVQLIQESLSFCNSMDIAVVKGFVFYFIFTLQYLQHGEHRQNKPMERYCYLYTSLRISDRCHSIHKLALSAVAWV